MNLLVLMLIYDEMIKVKARVESGNSVIFDNAPPPTPGGHVLIHLLSQSPASRQLVEQSVFMAQVRNR